MNGTKEKTGPAATGPVEIQNSNPWMESERTDPIMTDKTDKTNPTNFVGTVPAWTTKSTPSGEGYLFTRDSATFVRDAGDERSVAPILMQSAQLEINNSLIVATSDGPVISLDIDSVDIDGARDLIRALTELIDAFEGVTSNDTPRWGHSVDCAQLPASTAACDCGAK